MARTSSNRRDVEEAVEASKGPYCPSLKADMAKTTETL